MEEHSNINNMFIPYELALQLKGLECDITTLAYYDNKGVFYPMGNVCTWESIHFGEFIPKYQYVEGLSILVSAPTWCQVFDWFRNAYNLYYPICVDDAEQYCFSIPLSERLFDTIDFCYVTYEEARLSCLEKLIELVESKKDSV